MRNAKKTIKNRKYIVLHDSFSGQTLMYVHTIKVCEPLLSV